jgi:hypothetical protein
MSLSLDVLHLLNETVTTSSLDELRKQFDQAVNIVSKSLSAVKEVLQRYSVEIEEEKVMGLSFTDGVFKMFVRLKLQDTTPDLNKLLTQDLRNIRGVDYDKDIKIEGVGKWQ